MSDNSTERTWKQLDATEPQPWKRDLPEEFNVPPRGRYALLKAVRSDDILFWVVVTWTPYEWSEEIPGETWRKFLKAAALLESFRTCECTATDKCEQHGRKPEVVHAS